MRLITLHGVRSKSLKLADKVTLKKQTNTENRNQDEMAESEGIQVIVNQVAIQAATAMMMALRETDMGP